MKGKKISEKHWGIIKKRMGKPLKKRAMHSAPKSLDVFKAIYTDLLRQQIKLEAQNGKLLKAQNEIQKSLEQFAQLYDRSPIGYISLNENGTITDSNMAVSAMLGMEKNDLLQQHFNNFIIDEDQNIFYTHYKNLLTTKRPQKCELRLLGKGGSQLWSKIECVPTKDGNAEPQFLMIISDITEYKKMGDELQRVKERYRSIVMDQDDFICRFDRNGKITFVNDAYCRCFDVKPEDLLGNNFIPNIHKEDLPLVESHFKNLTPLSPSKMIEHRVILPDGSICWQQWCGRAIFDMRNNLLEYQAVGRDITQAKKTEEALRKTQMELEQRVEERSAELHQTHQQLLHAEKLSAIGRLSASIAHEFNNPLYAIRNVLKGVSRRASLEDEDKSLIEEAIKECDRMKLLILNLIDFNRPTSGSPITVDINEILNSILLLGKKEFKKNNIDIEIRYDASLPKIIAVKDQLKQVFLNLLTNSIDACDGGGTITISTVAHEDNISIIFHDNGKGVKQEHMAHIFEPFFTTKAEVKGTGLGLSVSYGIVTSHGGTIQAQSEPGVGSTFIVNLPIRRNIDEREK